MILTCPECATGYFVDDAEIRPGGRSVRCAACGARWIAQLDRPLELVSTSEEGALGREAAADAPLTADDLPKVFRARASDQRKMREATIAGLVWGGVGLAILVIVAAAIVFRVAVVRAIPSTAAAYAAIGLPVNRVGLTIEQVRAEPALQDGHAALSVSGVIRNIEDHVIVAPPLRVVLFNAQGKRVAGKEAPGSDPRIPPGQTRYFVVTLLDPPLSAHDLQVDFDIDAKGRPAMARVQTAPAPAAASAPVLRGMAAPDAPSASAPMPTMPAAASGPAPAAPPAAGPPAPPHDPAAAPAGKSAAPHG